MVLKALIFSSTPMLGKALARVVEAGGGQAKIVLNIDDFASAVSTEEFHLACTSVRNLSTVSEVLPQSVQLMLLLDSDLVSVLDVVSQQPRINHLFGLRYPDAPARPWELLAITRRWADGSVPSMQSYLSWGGTSFERCPCTDRDRDALVSEVEQFAGTFVAGRMASSVAEVAHELLMNAMYDAPVDATGKALFAHDRTAAIELPQEARPRFCCACDGVRLILSVKDPFGRLTRNHVFGGLQRSLTMGTMDQGGGGAGLGFMVMYRASTMLFFDVKPGVRTQATTVLELDVPQRELRKLPRSVHFYQEVD
jgi:hypothetical protein